MTERTDSERTDYKPAPFERRILEGRALPSPSPRYELALSIRRLNQRLGALPPERQRELLPDWNVSWDELTRQRDAARNDADELAAVANWEHLWRERLKQTFEASPGTSRGINHKPPTQPQVKPSHVSRKGTRSPARTTNADRI